MSEQTKTQAITHSPTPWFRGMGPPYNSDGKVGIYGDDDYLIVIADFTSEDVGPELCNANADFGLRAVNAHDDLLTACESIISGWEANDRVCPASMMPGIDRARAAIAKARTP